MSQNENRHLVPLARDELRRLTPNSFGVRSPCWALPFGPLLGPERPLQRNFPSGSGYISTPARRTSRFDYRKTSITFDDREIYNYQKIGMSKTHGMLTKRYLWILIIHRNIHNAKRIYVNITYFTCMQICITCIIDPPLARRNAQHACR